MTRNNALLEATMQAVIDHPEEHNQDWYFIRTECGTSMCFAGWALHIAGWEPIWERDREHVFGDWKSSDVKQPGATFPHCAADTACKLLGINYDDRKTLFSPSNTVSMLQEMVKDLVNGDELRPWHEYAIADTDRT